VDRGERDTCSAVDVHDPELAASDQFVSLGPSDAEHRSGLVDLQEKLLALPRLGRTWHALRTPLDDAERDTTSLTSLPLQNDTDLLGPKLGPSGLGRDRRDSCMTRSALGASSPGMRTRDAPGV
jgi:hypothetical protein